MTAQPIDLLTISFALMIYAEVAPFKPAGRSFLYLVACLSTGLAIAIGVQEFSS